MQLTSGRILAIGFMLFALFFGAGNLIFPAALGQSAGLHIYSAVAGFCVTGAGLPLMGVAAMARSGCETLQEAASRVHPWYGLFFTALAYLAIGPCYALPRAGTVSFEIAIRPFLGGIDSAIAQPAFLAAFFLAAWWFAASPSKLVDWIGKVLTPALLAGLAVLLLQSYLTPLGLPTAPEPLYATPLKAAEQGLLDGYNTLDAVVAFIFASFVVSIVKENGASGRKEVARAVCMAGLIAVCCLALVYVFIAKLGAESVTAIGMQDTGAPVLAECAKLLLGHTGAAILSVIILLACLSTAIGLITCCAGYAITLLPQVPYRAWAAVFALASCLIGLLGLRAIIAAAIPVLMFIYPLVVALGVLLLLHDFFGGRRCVYAWTIGCTSLMAFVYLLRAAGAPLGGLEGILSSTVPLYSSGLGWLPFAAAGFAIGLGWKEAVPEKMAA